MKNWEDVLKLGEGVLKVGEGVLKVGEEVLKMGEGVQKWGGGGVEFPSIIHYKICAYLEAEKLNVQIWGRDFDASVITSP